MSGRPKHTTGIQHETEPVHGGGPVYTGNARANCWCGWSTGWGKEAEIRWLASAHEWDPDEDDR